MSMSSDFEQTKDSQANFTSYGKVDSNNSAIKSDRLKPNIFTPIISSNNRLTSSPSLNLQIDRLILHGFPASTRDRIGTAMKAELTRLFTEQGIPSSLAQGEIINQLDGGNFEVAAHTPPRTIGTRIARAIYRGLSHE